MVYFSTIETSLGFMRACVSDTGLFRLDWQQSPFAHSPAETGNSNDVSHETICQLDAYLNGKLRAFTLPLDLSGYSAAFQTWLKIMSQIPYGQTISYADFAEKWGNRRAARAAGGACQRNPLPIILPCHRVIKGDGRFDNYSGGDNKNPRHPDNIYRKQWLIELERETIAAQP